MSKLYYSEQGNVIPSLCEELTDYRHARKHFYLPGTRDLATLYILARSYPDNSLPLRVSVNGTELAPVLPLAPNIYFWYDVPIPPTLLVAGQNVFEFWSDSQSMNAWSLALENGHKTPDSFVSTDYGQTWRNEKLGYHNTSLGEYVVRLRLSEGKDPAPPPMIWEEREHPRLARVRALIPGELQEPGPTLDRVRKLSTWVSKSWYYRNTGTATQYGPWDAETILAWGKAEQGHNSRKPIVMCVHYAIVFVTSCTALGIPARAAVFTGAINGFNGHFTGEVWLDKYAKWVMIDPTVDALFVQDGVPLSVTEIQTSAPDLAHLMERGQGHAYQIQNQVIADWIPENLEQGVCFRHRSLWPRTDFLAHPELTPPGHGETAYSETNLVWEESDLKNGFGMFPYFGNTDYFNSPPSGLNR